MKKTLLIGMAFGAVALTATASSAAILGSLHDLSASKSFGNASDTRICIYCHTPHNAIRAGATANN